MSTRGSKTRARQQGGCRRARDKAQNQQAHQAKWLVLERRDNGFSSDTHRVCRCLSLRVDNYLCFKCTEFCGQLTPAFLKRRKPGERLFAPSIAALTAPPTPPKPLAHAGLVLPLVLELFRMLPYLSR